MASHLFRINSIEYLELPRCDEFTSKEWLDPASGVGVIHIACNDTAMSTLSMVDESLCGLFRDYH